MVKEYIISEISIKPTLTAAPNSNPLVQEVTAIQTTGATFQINNATLYVPVVILSINDNIKFLENLNQGYQQYRSETTTQTKNNNLDYLTDPTFRNINRLFVLSFKNSNDDPTRDSFDQY